MAFAFSKMKETQRAWLYQMIGGKYRCWEDFEKLGFISAGHDDPPSWPLLSMREGDTVFVYTDRNGYFAKATVLAQAVRPRDFEVQGPFVHLQDGSDAGNSLPLDKVYTKRSYLRNDQNTELSEFAVRVRWEVILPRKKAKAFPHIQVPQTTAEELTDQKTKEFLNELFPKS